MTSPPSAESAESLPRRNWGKSARYMPDFNRFAPRDVRVRVGGRNASGKIIRAMNSSDDTVSFDDIDQQTFSVAVFDKVLQMNDAQRIRASMMGRPARQTYQDWINWLDLVIETVMEWAARDTPQLSHHIQALRSDPQPLHNLVVAGMDQVWQQGTDTRVRRGQERTPFSEVYELFGPDVFEPDQHDQQLVWPRVSYKRKDQPCGWLGEAIAVTWIDGKGQEREMPDEEWAIAYRDDIMSQQHLSHSTPQTSFSSPLYSAPPPLCHSDA